MIIRIKNLRLRTIVGVNDWERAVQQEVILNISMDCDIDAAAKSDDLADTVDYKTLKLRIMRAVETANFLLLERLARHVLDIIRSEPRVRRATVEIDKPSALRFADSVSVEDSFER